MFSRRFIIAQILFLSAAATLGFFYYPQTKSPPLPVHGTVKDFKLKDQHGKDITLADFKGKLWVADLIFTTCSGICPMMSKNMLGLHQAFAHLNDVRMVSISVNPENDTPQVLSGYAKKYGEGKNWIFLTGPRAEIQKLAVESFKMGDMKEIVFHSALFVLIDRRGQIRGYYDGTDEDRLAQLYKDLPLLERERGPLPLMPTINASLNGLAGVFLLLGFLAIKRRDKVAHRKWMISAFVCSALFLCAYVYYHATTHLLTRYQGQGMGRAIYFFILGTHTPLAVLIVPFIIMAIRHAIRGEFQKHKRITRWLYPAWMYVSVTGVLIYLMLYVFKPA
ncbi:MAG: DUF420 domain-containing protein [Candidatus Omnitrophica bacterium]|nr:DUF420 domain-containing protein [Candidatus Omnitrophota bacterium]